MNSLVSYDSDEDHDKYKDAVAPNRNSALKRDDDTNYDDVLMDMSEDSDGDGQRQTDRRRAKQSEKRDNTIEERRQKSGSTSQTESEEDSAKSDQDNERKRSGSRNDRHYNRDEKDDRRNESRENKRIDKRDDRRRNYHDTKDDRRGDRYEKRSDRRDRRDYREDKRNHREDRREDRHDHREDRHDHREDRHGHREERHNHRDDKRDDKRDVSRESSDRGSEKRSLATRPDSVRGSEDSSNQNAPPSLMELKPFSEQAGSSHDSSSRRDKDRERDKYYKERSRGRSDRYYNSRCDSRGRSRSRERGHHTDSNRGCSSDRNMPGASGAEYSKVSYKVNKKLQAMEKMGLQIKTPDGSMTTAQELRAKAPNTMTGGTSSLLPAYYNPNAVNAAKIIDQVQKRKLLWGNKGKKEGEEQEKVPKVAAQWTAAKFSDGKQVNKFMRLMGIKDPDAVVAKTEPEEDVNKKQEELFQAMQAQYDVARATTHTMRGVGLGFQRQL